MSDDLEERASHELRFASHAIHQETRCRREEGRARILHDDLRDPFCSHVIEPCTQEIGHDAQMGESGFRTLSSGDAEAAVQRDRIPHDIGFPFGQSVFDQKGARPIRPFHFEPLAPVQKGVRQTQVVQHADR
jgi:hypothetical protein